MIFIQAFRDHTAAAIYILMFSSAVVLIDIYSASVLGSLVDAISRDSFPDARSAVLEYAGLKLLFLCADGLVNFRLVIFNRHIMENLFRRAVNSVLSEQSGLSKRAMSGAISRIITRGIWASDDFVDSIVLHIFPAILVTTAITAILIYYWNYVGLIFLATVILHIITNIIMIFKYISPEKIVSIDLENRLSARIVDIVTCISVIFSAGKASEEKDTFEKLVDIWGQSIRKLWFFSLVARYLQLTLLQIGMLVMIGAMMFAWQSGSATVGSLVFVVTLMFIAEKYVQNIGRHLRVAYERWAELQSFNSLVHCGPNDDNVYEKTLHITAGAIEFKNVYFTRADRKHAVLQDVSFSINAGEKVGLVGPSGSGKSTIIDLVQGVLNPDQGEVRVDGQNIKYLSKKELRQHIVIVPQEPLLFQRSLRENIVYLNNSATDHQIHTVARLLGLHRLLDSLPEALETKISDRGSNLSGGERQRICILRALLADKKILIFDEATSALDYDTERDVLEAVMSVSESKTVIFCSHRVAPVDRMDRVIDMSYLADLR